MNLWRFSHRTPAGFWEVRGSPVAALAPALWVFGDRSPHSKYKCLGQHSLAFPADTHVLGSTLDRFMCSRVRACGLEIYGKKQRYKRNKDTG